MKKFHQIYGFSLNCTFAFLKNNFMKLKVLYIFFFLISFSVFSQGKVGAVDIKVILDNMPEMKDVEENLKTYSAQLDMDLDKKLNEYKVAFEDYKKQESSLTENQKKDKQEALIEMEKEIQRFQQTGATLLDLKEQEFLRPLYAKIEKALEKVARENNFTQVNQITANLLFLDPDYDLTPAILKELGVEIKDEK